MNFITRNKYWILLIWYLIVLIFFKIYNNFIFKNNESILFIVLITIFPIVIEILTKIRYLKNKKIVLNREIESLGRNNKNL